MASSYFTTLLSIILLFFFLFGIASSQLSPFSYSRTCPQAKFKIKAAVNTAVRNERRMGASLLRLHFHDCFVNGCDASVLLDDTATFTGEKTAIPNANSLRGFDVIDTIKADLERQCPGVVSCADILAIAARDAVVALGGFSWPVLVGRKDSLAASKSDANTNLPSPFADLTNLITFFNNKGFTTAEMVALSGSHSIGQARCSLFRNRIYNENNIDATFAASLKATCPTSGGDTNLSPLDGTPNFFDNNYYRNLVSLKGLMHSDQVLFNNGSTDAQVRGYSLRPTSFLRDFANAMEKMSKMGPPTGINGQIRTNCRNIN